MLRAHCLLFGIVALLLPGCAATATAQRRPAHWQQMRLDAALQLAEENARTGRFDRARALLASYTDRTDARVPLALARFDLEEGRYDAALRRLEAARGGTTPDKPEWYRLRAIACEGLGRWAEAAQAYEQAYSLQPDLQMLLGWVEMLARDGRIGEARRVLDEYRRTFPGTPALHATAARLALEADDIEDAISELRLASLLEPDVPHWRLMLAETYLRAGRYRAAIDTAQRLLDENDDAPTRTRAAHCVGMALLALGDAQGAYTQFRAADRNAPDPATRLGLALAALGCGRVAEARRLAAELATLDPQSPEIAALRDLCRQAPVSPAATKVAPRDTTPPQVRESLTPPAVSPK